MVLEVFVGKHGLVGNCIIGYADVRRPSKISEHVVEIFEVVPCHTLQDILLVTSSADEELVDCKTSILSRPTKQDTLVQAVLVSPGVRVRSIPSTLYASDSPGSSPANQI